MGSGGVEAVDVRYEQVKLPGEDLLGKPGLGFEILRHWISIEKALQCAAAVGIGQAALDEAINYAKTRLTKGKPVSDMQGIR